MADGRVTAFCSLEMDRVTLLGGVAASPTSPLFLGGSGHRTPRERLPPPNSPDPSWKFTRIELFIVS